MKKFSLKSFIPKFFLLKEDEEPKRKISIRDYFDEAKLSTADAEKAYGPKLNQIYIFKDLKKDVTINCAVIKGPKPWTLEYVVAFRFQPTHNFVIKHLPIKRKKREEDPDVFRNIREYPEHVTAYMKSLESRFGKKVMYIQINNLKNKVDEQFFNQYPILEWADPKIAYLWSEGIIDNFISSVKGVAGADSYGTQERDTGSFETREGDNIDFGFYIRFELPLNVTVDDENKTADQKINKYISYKAKYFGEQLLNLPMLTSDEDFALKPGIIERT